MSTIGDRIKEVRRGLKLNQSDFGKRIGVTHAHISKIESGKDQPSESLLKVISYEFGLSSNWLRHGTGPQNATKSPILMLVDDQPDLDGKMMLKLQQSLLNQYAGFYNDIVNALQPSGAALGFVPFMTDPTAVAIVNHLQDCMLLSNTVEDRIRYEARYEVAFPDFRKYKEALQAQMNESVPFVLDLNATKNKKRPQSEDQGQHIIEENLPTQYFARLPLVGQVAAGLPNTAIEIPGEYITVPAELVSQSDCFALKVKGESMINAGIAPGDVLIVHRQETAENGDIVVAMVNHDEATVKRFFREADHIRLQPENDVMEPVLTTDVTIIGKVINVCKSAPQ